MTSLLKYAAACRAVAEAKKLDEVRDWEDKAAAVREYTHRVGNRQLELARFGNGLVGGAASCY
jgi:hypothetical protein